MPDIIEREYQPGDSALIPSAERDPFDAWHAFIEREACGLTSYEVDGKLVAVIGFIPIWDGVADAFALIDRARSVGSGSALAKAVKARIIALMREHSLHRVQCVCALDDRAAQVFLRALGYRPESIMRKGSPEKTDLMLHTILEP